MKDESTTQIPTENKEVKRKNWLWIIIIISLVVIIGVIIFIVLFVHYKKDDTTKKRYMKNKRPNKLSNLLQTKLQN